jgi:hypothetical protein
MQLCCSYAFAVSCSVVHRRLPLSTKAVVVDRSSATCAKFQASPRSSSSFAQDVREAQHVGNSTRATQQSTIAVFCVHPIRDCLYVPSRGGMLFFIASISLRSMWSATVTASRPNAIITPPSNSIFVRVSQKGPTGPASEPEPDSSSRPNP